MLVSRREFLKLILGTVPAAALSGPLAALWPDEAKSRPVADPITLYLDRDWAPGEALLVGDASAAADEYFPPRREYYDWEALSLKERVEYWLDGWGAAAHDGEFIWGLPDVEDWTAADLAQFNAFEAKQRRWLDAPVEIDEMSERDLAAMTQFGAGYELFDQVGGGLGLYETYCGSPGGGGWYVAFRGDVEQLNAGLAALGINVVVLDPDADDEEDDDDWLEGGVSA
jgi:hypothetical protein